MKHRCDTPLVGTLRIRVYKCGCSEIDADGAITDQSEIRMIFERARGLIDKSIADLGAKGYTLNSLN